MNLLAPHTMEIPFVFNHIEDCQSMTGPISKHMKLLEAQVATTWVSMARGGNHARLESSAIVRERVARACERQMSRQGKANSLLQPREIERWCALDEDGEALIKNAFARLSLSARAYHRILKVARTVADLASSDRLAARHVAEAISYRRFDRT